jgi:hypothetical protein
LTWVDADSYPALTNTNSATQLGTTSAGHQLTVGKGGAFVDNYITFHTSSGTVPRLRLDSGGYFEVTGAYNGGSSIGTAFKVGGYQGVTEAYHIRPFADSLYDLGTNTVRYRNVYADTLYGDGSNLTGVSSAEVYGFNQNSTGNLIVTTTNGGADNISASDYAAFEDTIFAATGISFSINASGNLIATIS